MIRCIAVDDEPLALELLEDNIRTVPFLQLVRTCANAMEAMQVFQCEPVDLVFSDIQMPGLNGLQLISAVAVKPMFILITAHEKFALEGYALDVVDYLLKPVSYERFVKACNKALERGNVRQQQPKPVLGADTREFIFVPLDYKMVKVALGDVVHFEADKDYVRIHFNTGKRPLLVRMSLKAMDDMLPAGKFIRIHKSHIVSIGSITAVRRTGLFIGNLELPISDQHRDAVQRLIEGR